MALHTFQKAFLAVTYEGERLRNEECWSMLLYDAAKELIEPIPIVVIFGINDCIC
jgi:hypothetical protein